TGPHPDRLVPAVGVGAAGDDVGLAAAELLPDQPGPAAAVGRHAVPDVRPGGIGDRDLAAELAVLVRPGEQAPILLPLFRPDDPKRVVVRAGQGHAEVVAGVRDDARLRPRAVRAVALDEQHAVALLLICDPRQVMPASL